MKKKDTRLIFPVSPPISLKSSFCWKIKPSDLGKLNCNTDWDTEFYTISIEIVEKLKVIALNA